MLSVIEYRWNAFTFKVWNDLVFNVTLGVTLCQNYYKILQFTNLICKKKNNGLVLFLGVDSYI